MAAVARAGAKPARIRNVFIDNSGAVNADLWFIGNTMVVTSDFRDGQPHSVSVGYDAGTTLFSLNVDGSIVTDFRTWSRSPAADVVRVGNWSNNTDHVANSVPGVESFNGTIDNVVIVPEPSSALFLGLVGFGVWIFPCLVRCNLRQGRPKVEEKR